MGDGSMCRDSILVYVLCGIIFWGTPGPSAAADGPAIYRQYCATCHGLDTRGGNASSLFDDRWEFGARPAQIRANIVTGIATRGMPAFGRALNTGQVDALLSYMAATQGRAPAPPAPRRQVAETLDYRLRVEHWIPAEAGLATPWAIDFIDADTALVTEKPGRLRLVVKGHLHPDPVRDTPRVLDAGQGGLLDVAVDPDYAAGGWIYLGYSHEAGRGARTPAMTRIVRGRIRHHAWVDEAVIFEAPRATYINSRYHYGTRIVFDPAGHLYFSIGDRGLPDQAQDLSRPNGKIHRLHRDGRVPADNPFAGRADVLPSIFSLGHRNPQGLAVHPANGRLWALEHGPRGGDELNRIKAGGNYGWPVITYGINYSGTIITDQRRRDGLEQPIYFWRPSTAVCGLNFYTGDMFPFWQNQLLAANLKYQDVRLLTLAGPRVIHEEVILKDFGRVREAVGGPDGAIYVVINTPDEILRISAEGRRRY
jgi:glucose/arabinose dehydrogenase